MTSFFHFLIDYKQALMGIGVCSSISALCCICLCWMKRRKSRCTSVEQFHRNCWSALRRCNKPQRCFPSFFSFKNSHRKETCTSEVSVAMCAFSVNSTHTNLISYMYPQDKDIKQFLLWSLQASWWLPIHRGTGMTRLPGQGPFPSSSVLQFRLVEIYNQRYNSCWQKEKKKVKSKDFTFTVQCIHSVNCILTKWLNVY